MLLSVCVQFIVTEYDLPPAPDIVKVCVYGSVLVVPLLISIFAPVALIGAGAGFVFLGFGWWRWAFNGVLDAFAADMTMGGILVCITIFSLIYAIGQKEKY